MKRMLSGAARTAGCVALVAAAAMTGLAPAAAATPMNESYAVYATGRTSTQPVGLASYSGGSPVVLPNADAAGLLGTGLITDSAGAASAASRVPGLAVSLPGQAALHARLASSACRYDTGARRVSGTSRIDQGQITQAGRHPIALPASARPNTRLVIPGVAVIMLNRQFTGGRGTLTVEAIRIRLLGQHQKLILATSVCAAANLAPRDGAGGPGRPDRPGRCDPARPRRRGLPAEPPPAHRGHLTAIRPRWTPACHQRTAHTRPPSGQAPQRLAQRRIERVARRQPAHRGRHEVSRRQLRAHRASLHG